MHRVESKAAIFSTPSPPPPNPRSRTPLPRVVWRERGSLRREAKRDNPPVAIAPPPPLSPRACLRASRAVRPPSQTVSRMRSQDGARHASACALHLSPLRAENKPTRQLAWAVGWLACFGEPLVPVRTRCRPFAFRCAVVQCPLRRLFCLHFSPSRRCSLIEACLHRRRWRAECKTVALAIAKTTQLLARGKTLGSGWPAGRHEWRRPSQPSVLPPPMACRCLSSCSPAKQNGRDIGTCIAPSEWGCSPGGRGGKAEGPWGFIAALQCICAMSVVTSLVM